MIPFNHPTNNQTRNQMKTMYVPAIVSYMISPPKRFFQQFEILDIFFIVFLYLFIFLTCFWSIYKYCLWAEVPSLSLSSITLVNTYLFLTSMVVKNNRTHRCLWHNTSCHPCQRLIGSLHQIQRYMGRSICFFLCMIDVFFFAPGIVQYQRFETTVLHN